jgi:hypothetical protein
VAMLYAHLSHSIGLNDVSDALLFHSGPLSAIREATSPRRNGLSHASKERKAELAEEPFCAVLGHLPSLPQGSPYCGMMSLRSPVRAACGSPSSHVLFDKTYVDYEYLALSREAVKKMRRANHPLYA